MVIVPKDRPFIDNLSSYYLNVPRLLEHCQGELGSGAVTFKSSAAEGVIYFDRDELLDGNCVNKGDRMTGRAAIEFLLKSSTETNYAVSVYRMEPEQAYYWSSIPAAKRIYEDLSTEFTDLEGLMRKMGSEKLTGYIEVALNNGMENALIFYSNGQIAGGSYSWENGELSGSKEKLNLLVQKTKKSGGTFHVSRISMARGEGQGKRVDDKPSPEIITALEELLTLVEGMVSASKTAKADFQKLLRRRCLDLADAFAFLDPFTGEFEFANHKIKFLGKATDADIAKGILSAVKGIAEELGMGSQIQAKVAPWFQKHARRLASIGITP